MNIHNTINYIELPSKDLAATKSFYGTAFEWRFTDFGPDYTAFTDAGLDGGFFKSDQNSSTERGAVLPVIYSENHEATMAEIEDAGGTIVKPIFSFPGGRRFQFTDPTGNELAVWSDK